MKDLDQLHFDFLKEKKKKKGPDVVSKVLESKDLFNPNVLKSKQKGMLLDLSKSYFEYKSMGKENQRQLAYDKLMWVAEFLDLRIRLTEDELFFYEKDSGRAVFRYFSPV